MNPHMSPYRSHVEKHVSKDVPSTVEGTSGAAVRGVDKHRDNKTTNDDQPILRALHQLTLEWDDELLHKFQTEMWSLRHPSQWSWSTLALFLEFVFSSRHHHEHRCRATILLGRLVDECTEEQAYAIALHRPDASHGNTSHQNRSTMSSHSVHTVLDVLSRRLQVLPEQDTKPTPPTSRKEDDHESRVVSLTFLSSLVALASLWRALDRLDLFLSFSWSMGSGPPCGRVDAASDSERPWWRRKHPPRGGADPPRQRSETRQRTNTSLRMVQIYLALEALEGGNEYAPLKTPWDDQEEAIEMPSVAQLEKVGLRPVDIQTSILTYLYHAHINCPSHGGSETRAITTFLGSHEWSERLLVLASRLRDTNMPRTSYTYLSLAALRLLLVHRHSTATTSPSHNSSLQPTVAIVARSLLDFAAHDHHRQPRWARPQHHHSTNPLYKDDLYKWTFGIVMDWTTKHYHALPDVTANSSQALWTELLQRDVSGRGSDSAKHARPVPIDVAAALLVLSTQCRAMAREGLELAIQEQLTKGGNRSTTSHDLRLHGMEALVGRLTQEPSSLGSLLLMKILVSDGQSSLTHDCWSKALWHVLAESSSSASDKPSVNRLDEYARLVLRTAVAASEAQEKGWDRHIQYALMHPSLQCLLDLLHGLMTHVEAKRVGPSPFAPTLHTAQAIETLVQVMVPKQAKVDYTRDHDDNDSRSFSLDFDESITPTANNLSRVDASIHVCLQEHEHNPIGREPTLRLACANVLATLSHSFLDGDSDDSLTCSRRPLLQARIIEAVNSFVEDLGLGFVVPSQTLSETHSLDDDRSLYTGTLELTQRRLRLVTTLASSTNKLSYVASLMHRAETSQLREAQKWRAESIDTTLRVQELLQRQKQLETEKAELEDQLLAQQTALQEKMARFQRSCSQNAKQLVQVHQLESSRAERRAEEVTIRLKDMQDRLAHSERQLEASRKLEEESHCALDRAQKSVEELHRSHQTALQQSEACARELDDVREELQRTKPKLERLIRNERKMMAHIQLQEESRLALGESHDALKESLETLFSDMVSLAQLYESREKEEYKSREQEETTIDELTRKLRAERARYAQLEETYKQTEVNNNMLSSKYEKVRKLLEQEREERNSESARFAAEQRKRYGPASYMSHLHPTTGSSNLATGKSGRDGMRLVLSSTGGKENDRSTTSSSRSVNSKSSGAANSGRHYR